MTADELISAIRTKYPDVYPDKNLAVLVSGIENMTPVIREGLEKFLQTGQSPELEHQGYTVNRLAQEHGMNEIAALLTLDWIIRDPEKAIASLSRGHDTIHP